MNPAILKKLRSLYKIGVFYVEDPERSTAGANKRSSNQSSCKLRGYCYKSESGCNLKVHDHCGGNRDLTREIVEYINESLPLVALGYSTTIEFINKEKP